MKPTTTTTTTTEAAWFVATLALALLCVAPVPGVRSMWATATQLTAGGLYTWGINNWGNLGTGSLTPYEASAPVLAQTPSGASAVMDSSQGQHAFVVTKEGKLYGWGSNSQGQIGDGTTVTRAAPVLVPDIDDVVQVATGLAHTVALLSDGSVWTWGDNTYGQLGDKSPYPKTTPTQVTSISGVVAVGAGFAHSLAVKKDGTVWGWGENYYGQLGDGTVTNRNLPVQMLGISGAVAAAGGEYHSVVLKSDGTVWGVGDNYEGQLGNGQFANYKYEPVQALGITNAKAISVGNIHSVALLANGTVLCWGDNSYGQLGFGYIFNDSAVPMAVPGLTGINSIETTGLSTYAFVSDSLAYSWGDNEYGQLGDGTFSTRTSPVEVLEPQKPQEVDFSKHLAAGSAHSVVAAINGTVLTWGSDFSGQLGDGSFTDRSTPKSVGISHAAVIAAGSSHTVVVDNSGSVFAFGFNNFGQLGNGKQGDESNVAVQMKNVSDAISAAAGAEHTLILRKDGTVWACGDNNMGQLGVSSLTSSAELVQVDSLAEITAIAACGKHSLALSSTGVVYAWGEDMAVAPSGSTFTSVPTIVSKLITLNITAVAAGFEHSLALTSNGYVYAWGENTYGQLGDYTLISKSTPVQAYYLSGAKLIGAGFYHSLAVTSTSVYSWGNNDNGQLGIGYLDSYSPYPTIVSNVPSTLSAVSGGSGHSLFLTQSSAIWAVGANDAGQLGDGTTVPKSRPVLVSQL